MTPLVEFASESVLCRADDSPILPSWFTADRRTLRAGEIFAFDVTGDVSAVMHLSSTATDDLPRIMDHFYLWTPRTRPAARQLLLDALFELTAVDFDHIIHSEQNWENIQNLLAAISQFFGKLQGLKILDFGCGSGVSAAIAINQQFSLIGYDRCAAMRSIATKQGLRVLTPEEFAASPDASIDAIFASYVFHLGPSPDDLSHVWDLLRPGGIVVANFHKDHRVAEVTNCFSSLGGNSRTIHCEHSFFRHGSYRLYIRNG